MQSSRYWIEKAFQDAKGNCGMAEYPRNWNAWHHHMALSNAYNAYFTLYQKKFNKMYKISIPGSYGCEIS